AHTPLAVMLVLTQLSVGTFVVDLLVRLLTNRSGRVLPVVDAAIVVAVATLALAASVLHLGRPRYAYRAVIRLRHSWLSREVVAFGTFTALAVPYALLLALGGAPGVVLDGLGMTVAIIGIAGIACSVAIYATTRRQSWRPASVGATFAATSVA